MEFGLVDVGILEGFSSFLVSYRGLRCLYYQLEILNPIKMTGHVSALAWVFHRPRESLASQTTGHPALPSKETVGMK